MRITLIAVGARGDVQPYVALGCGLRAAGYTVQIATQQQFMPLVHAYGLDVAPIRGDLHEVLMSPAGQQWIRSGRNPLGFLHGYKALIQKYLANFLADCTVLGAESDALIYSSLAVYTAPHIAEQRRIPVLAAFLQPVSRTTKFPSLIAPLSSNLGSSYNLITHYTTEMLLWQPFRTTINHWRQEQLGLAPIPVTTNYLGDFFQKRVSILYGYSAVLVPKPSDWGDWLTVTGSWFLKPPPFWQPPQEIEQFLASGPAPVYVSFGSTIDMDASMQTLLVQALDTAGLRGIIAGSVSQHDLPDTMLAVDDVPHDWLFPQLAGVVHHGGAGTTAAGLQAGLPAITIPAHIEQRFWGERLAALGAGLPPLARSHLTRDQLVTALRTITHDQSLRERAEDLGARIRAEHGVERAVERVQALFGAP